MSDSPVNRPKRLQELGGQSRQPAPSAPQRPATTSLRWEPPPLASIEDTGLSKLGLADLALKVLYFSGDMLGSDVAEVLKLPFAGVLDQIFEFMRREKYIEVKGSGGFGDAGYRYLISSKGSEKAREALERTQYAGAAPVPLKQYIESLHLQNKERPPVHRTDLHRLMDNLVVADDMLDKVGPAVNSGRSIFLYGPPGNGKTTIAERVGRMILGDDMWVPYAVDVDGQVIQVFDSVNHEVSENQRPVKHGTGITADPRWILIKRPMIMVGGELTMAGLDLVYDEINKYYEAPFQVKSNGGMFLIDDFGRQQVRAVDLLNRWIVPLEKRVDFLTLNNGRKIEIPFYVLIIFSTNMDPKDLVDEAFLRRIRHKIEVGNPTFEQFRDIFKIMCKVKRVPYDEQGLAWLIKEWYINYDRDMRMVHPRDILSQLIDIAGYYDVQPTMSKELLDLAARSYFVEL
ncbi:MAG: ATP-binding protein [Anaerolineae bacterium]|nr:ATP-binding protein [Anaerolineae bacterium]